MLLHKSIAGKRKQHTGYKWQSKSKAKAMLAAATHNIVSSTSFCVRNKSRSAYLIQHSTQCYQSHKTYIFIEQ